MHRKKYTNFLSGYKILLGKHNSYKNLIKNKTDNTAIQFFRYVIVGGLAYVADFSLLFVFTEFFKIYYLTSAGMAFVAGMTLNYVLSTVWVFKRRMVKNKQVEFLIFTSIGIIGLGLNQFFIWFFTEYIHLYYLLSKIVATASIFLWNFFVRKYILFR